jgi:hypothetical protein
MSYVVEHALATGYGKLWKVMFCGYRRRVAPSNQQCVIGNVKTSAYGSWILSTGRYSEIRRSGD